MQQDEETFTNMRPHEKKVGIDFSAAWIVLVHIGH
jgi:hypothetical protein